jgi:hypothetical protein
VAVPQPSGLGGGSLYYLFKVIGGKPASQPPFSTVAAEVRQALTEHLRERLIESFTSTYEKRWRARTRCLPAFTVPVCGDQTRGREGKSKWKAKGGRNERG